MCYDVTNITALVQCGSVGTLYILEDSLTPSFLPHSTQCTFFFAPLSQDGSTAVQLAAFKGHKDLVQELCEIFGADFLHRNKVRAMQTVTVCGSVNCACVASM